MTQSNKYSLLIKSGNCRIHVLVYFPYYQDLYTYTKKIYIVHLLWRIHKALQLSNDLWGALKQTKQCVKKGQILGNENQFQTEKYKQEYYQL